MFLWGKAHLQDNNKSIRETPKNQKAYSVTKKYIVILIVTSTRHEKNKLSFKKEFFDENRKDKLFFNAV